MPLIDADGLGRLEASVAAALAAGDDSGLAVLGYGEITLVVGWPHDEPAVAAKRLPVFASRHRAEAYGRLVEDYLGALRDRGVHPVDSEYHVTDAGLGLGWAAYVVQPILPPGTLGPAALRAHADAGDVGAARGLLGRIVSSIAAAVGGPVGLDGQISNWADRPDGLAYFDVTTPMLNDSAGATRLDLRLLTSPLPAATRPLVRRFVAPGITAKYHQPRDVLVDLAANLLKEKLGDWVAPTVELANEHVTVPITVDEVHRYYRSDAVTWEALLRLRRADRWWQQTVRRRPYGSLLPHDVAR